MPAYRVELEDYTHSHEYATEQYGDWSSSSSWSFKKIWYVDDIEINYADITSELDIKPGEEIYVVWVTYDTGDSFGYASQGSSASVAVFKDFEAAEDFKKHIESEKYTPDQDKEYYYQNVYEALDGQTVHFYASWVGYFERLAQVNIEHTRVM